MLRARAISPDLPILSCRPPSNLLVMVPGATSRLGSAWVLDKQVGTYVLLVVVPDEILYGHRAMEVDVDSRFEPPMVGVSGFIPGY
jgi:hypothetical protein